MLKTRFNDLGNKGLNSDIAEWELPPEYITFGINFRVSGNSIESTRSFDVWSDPSGSPSLLSNAGHLLSVDVANVSFWMILTRDSVWIYDGALWFDISNPAGYVGLGPEDEFFWTSTMLGTIPIINNRQHYPEYWSPQASGQVMQELEFSPGLTWRDAGKNCKVMRSYKNFLFALNLTESGVELPNSYRWSHPADQNGLPFSWDPNDQSTIASIEQISGDSGAIVDGLPLRNSFAIYSERGINILDFVGGEFVFDNRELSSTYGLLSPNCIAEVNGVHYFISDSDILMNDGNTVKSIIYDRIRERFNSQINSEFFDTSYVVVNKRLKEIYFCVPEDTATTPNVAYIYNFYKDTWSIKLLPDNTAYIAYGSISAKPITYETPLPSYATIQLTWGTTNITPLGRTLMSLDKTDGSLSLLDPIVSVGSNDVESRIERTNLPLEDVDNITTLTRVYPLMEGTADVEIQFGSHEYPGSAVRWKPVQIFNPSTDRKLDIRTTGELHAWRIQSIGTGWWSLSGMVIEYANAGKR